MLDHLKAATMTLLSFGRDLARPFRPDVWRYRYKDALYEIRNPWDDYHGEFVEYCVVDDAPNPDGDRDYPGPESLDDIKKMIDDGLAALTPAQSADMLESLTPVKDQVYNGPLYCSSCEFNLVPDNEGRCTACGAEHTSL